MSDSILKEHPTGQPLRERFIHLARGFVRYCLKFPMEFRFIEHFHNSPYGVAHRRDKVLAVNGDDVLRNLFEEARAAHIIRELPDPVLFALAFAPLIDVVRDHVLGFVVLDDQMIDGILDACWGAIKVHQQERVPKFSERKAKVRIHFYFSEV